MNSITKLALGISGTILIAGASFGDEVVRLGPVGQGGQVSFIKPSPPSTSVALYHDRHAPIKSTRSEQKHGKRVWHTAGPFGDGGYATYWESR